MYLFYSWVISHFVISVKADEDLHKYMLEHSSLGQTLWKHKFPQDMEDKGKVRLSSEDEAEGMPLVPHQAHQAVRPPTPLVSPPDEVPTTSGTSYAPAAVGSVAAALAASTAEGGPSPDEVVVKKAVLVLMKHQMAALIQGKELPAPQPQARDILEVPYAVPAVGRDDTK